MQADFLAQPRSARTRLVAVVAALLIVAVAVTVLISRSRSQGSTRTAAAVPTSSTDVTGAPLPVASAISSAPAQQVKLVAGSRKVKGVAVGYPHTMAGAVSAAVEATTDLGGTLDFDRAETIGAVVDDPANGHTAAYFAQGVALNRKNLGLPVTGAVPTGASMSAGPVSYQLRNQTKNSVTVLLLCYLTWITPAKGMHNVVIVVGVPMVWTHGDWKQSITPVGAPDYAELRYQPGSSQAVAAGWLALTA